MNETFKTELAAFAADIREICKGNALCLECPFMSKNGFCSISPNSGEFDPEAAIAAVEAYRKRKKPCAEVIDRAVDIYTLEIEIERKGAAPNSVLAKHYADGLRKHLTADYGRVINGNFSIRVLSAKRFVLESHRESDGDKE